MRTFSARIVAGCGALLLGATLASAQLATQNDTVVTFSAPVSLPGVTLPAGSYLFKLADSQVNRNVVQVFAKDRSKIFATILAIPAERTEPADETVITFNEAPANSAPAVRYWYYPGDKRGQEFVYPKSQAIAIANAAHTSVLSVNSDGGDMDAMKSAEIARVEPGAEATPSQNAQAAPANTPDNGAQATQPRAAETTTPAAPVTEQAAPAAAPAPEAATAATPAPSPSATAQSPSTTAQSPSSNAAATQPRATSPAQPSAVGTSGTATTLPKTASPIPLIGFAGLLALGSAFGVRVVRRVRA